MTPDQLAQFQQMYTSGNSAVPAGSTGINAGATDQTAGTAGATGALTALGGFNAGSTNNMPGVMSTAQQYVNGSNIPAQVQNAMLSATQEANEVTNPGTESAAAGNGNINGSRTGLAEGLVDSNLAEQAATMSGSLQGQAYDTGSQLGENMLTTNNAQNEGALAAALTGGTSLVNSGSVAGSGGVSNLENLEGLAETGATGEQTNNQLGLTNQEQQFQSASTSPYANVDQLMQLLQGNYGQETTGTSTSTSTPSALSIIGGLMGAGGSLLGSGGSTSGSGASGILGLLKMLSA